MIWEFRPPNQQHTHYIMGTMHLRSHAAFTYSGQAETYMTRCTQFAAEANVSELESKSSAYLLPSDTSIRLLLGEKKWEKIKAVILQSFGLNCELYNHTLPFFLTSLLAAKCAAEDYPLTLDQHLWQVAEDQKMTLLGLESYQDQLAVLDSIPLSYQLKELRTIVGSIGAFRHRMLTIQQLYARNDMRQLYQLTRKQTGQIRRQMLHDRNERMAGKLMTLATDNAVFAAVGASHLGGNIGILAHLKRRKCAVRQLIK